MGIGESLRTEVRRALRHHKEATKKALTKLAKDIDASERGVRATAESQIRNAAMRMAEQRAALDCNVDSIKRILNSHLPGFLAYEEVELKDAHGIAYGVPSVVPVSIARQRVADKKGIQVYSVAAHRFATKVKKEKKMQKKKK